MTYVRRIRSPKPATQGDSVGCDEHGKNTGQEPSIDGHARAPSRYGGHGGQVDMRWGEANSTVTELLSQWGEAFAHGRGWVWHCCALINA
jgi:hypothetical protein